MSGPNGHAKVNDSTVSSSLTVAANRLSSPFTPEKVKEFVAALEVPFDPSQIEWRVMNTTKKGQSLRGLVVPYADQRAYTDRLNALFTPAGWTRRYTIHTSANFERRKDQKIVAKVLIACELTIFGLGSHSAMGEEFADNDNAGTAAEAQAFKRSCACFGLGRYLYYFTGTWVDVDDQRRPKAVPHLAGWATPAGWLQGLRPSDANEEERAKATTTENGGTAKHNRSGMEGSGDLLREIERMENVVGKRMYRGLLKSVARVWNPKGIQDPEIMKKVLAHIQAAERGISRAKTARDKAGLTLFATVLSSMKLSSLEQVDNLKTLQEIVLALEAAVRNSSR